MKMAGKRRKTGPWPRLQKFWDIRAACNFIGGGTGSGLLLLAAVFVLLGQPSVVALVAGVVSISFGLLMVFLEIGRPWRSINMFFHPQTSWMTREGIVVMPLFLSAGLVFLYTGQSVGSVAALFMGLLALAFLYCQLNMLHASRGIPAWRQPRLKPYLFVTGLTEAQGIALCLPGLIAVKQLWLALGLFLLLRLVFWKNYARNLHIDKAPEASRSIIDGIYWQVLLGNLLPIVLLVAAWLSEMLIFTVIAGLLAAATGWYTKIIIITRAAQTRGFTIPRTPVRGQGQSRVL